MPDPAMTMPIDAAAFAQDCAPVPPADFVAAVLRTGFSPDAYRDAYGDLAERQFTPTQSLLHYLRHGLNERRRAPLTLDRDALLDLARLPMHDLTLKSKLLTALAAALFRGVPRLDGAGIADRWPFIRALAATGARPYVICGDSHSNHFALTGVREGEWLLPLHLLCTAGSARGLGNPDSVSGYGGYVRQTVETIRTLPGGGEVPFLLQFGQVDVEFVHHYQRIRDARQALDLNDYRSFCDATLQRYIPFVTALFDGRRRLGLFLISLFPPALSDEAWRQGWVNDDVAWRESSIALPELSQGVRRLQVADLRERTEIHAYFNAGLRMACRQHGIRFVDCFTPFLGDDGVVDPRYRVPEAGGVENHLDSRATYAPISTMLWHCIDALPRPAAFRTA